MANNELLSLNEIFNNKLFRIPDYQRGYAWGESQLEDFWEDIINIKDGEKHYTGLLTVEAISKQYIKNSEKWEDDTWLLDSGYKAYYIIDGQQRLTTSIILLNTILDYFSDEDHINYQSKQAWQERFLFKKYQDKFETYIFGYEKDNPSNEYFKTHVLNQRSFQSDKHPTETFYTANLRCAKELFKKKVEKLQKEHMAVIFNKVTNGLKFNFYEIDDELDVYVTFETMNNRGKPLSKLELLKNRLIYLSTLLDEDDKVKSILRKNINEVWKTIYEYLGKNIKKTLDDDDFLKNHWIMYFKYDRKQSNAYSNFLLNDHFTSKRALMHNEKEKIGFEEIDEYIISLAKSIEYWYYMHNPLTLNKTDEIKELFNKHNRLGWGAFEPLILAYLIKDYDDEKLAALLKATEEFIFLIFSISRRQSNTQNNNLYRMANQLNQDKLSIEEVTKEINKLIYYEYDDENYGWYDFEKFESYISEQFKKSSGFYSWNGLKYFLFEYEMHLQNMNKESIKVTWETVKNQNSIEHIFPQESSKYYWNNKFDGYSKKEKHKLLNSLGNLILLSKSKNSKLQNNGFDLKKKYYKIGSHSEIEVSSNDEWTPENILERGVRLLEFMEKKWDLTIENKKELLGLDFM